MRLLDRRVELSCSCNLKTRLSRKEHILLKRSPLLAGALRFLPAAPRYRFRMLASADARACHYGKCRPSRASRVGASTLAIAFANCCRGVLWCCSSQTRHCAHCGRSRPHAQVATSRRLTSASTLRAACSSRRRFCIRAAMARARDFTRAQERQHRARRAPRNFGYNSPAAR
jgi:hypothetical protein